MTEATSGAEQPTQSAETRQPATEVTETPTARPQAEFNLLGVAAVAVVVGAAVVATAYQGSFALLLATAAMQALLALGWVFGTGMPGRRGALVVAALAAAGADVSVSLFPEARLGPLAAVLGLALPVAFVHQLLRGAARVQLVSSLSAVAVLALSEIAASSLLQLRHEVTGDSRVLGGDIGGKATAAVALAAFVAIVVGCLMDLVAPAPRFDPRVPRGMLGLVAAAGVGAAAAHFVLRDVRDFADGRGAFLGAAVGAVAGLLAIAMAFVQHTTPRGSGTLARVGRPLYAALLPVCLLAPAAFLLCLAIRT